MFRITPPSHGDWTLSCPPLHMCALMFLPFLFSPSPSSNTTFASFGGQSSSRVNQFSKHRGLLNVGPLFKQDFLSPKWSFCQTSLFPLISPPTSGRWEMEGKAAAEYLTVSEVKTHYPFVVPRLSERSQCCPEGALSPSSRWVRRARQRAAVFSARPSQASWMALRVLTGSWVTSWNAMNQELTKLLIHVRDTLKCTSNRCCGFHFQFFNKPVSVTYVRSGYPDEC